MKIPLLLTLDSLSTNLISCPWSHNNKTDNRNNSVSRTIKIAVRTQHVYINQNNTKHDTHTNRSDDDSLPCKKQSIEPNTLEAEGNHPNTTHPQTRTKQGDNLGLCGACLGPIGVGGVKVVLQYFEFGSY